jgi:hypothetical protein
MITLLRHEVRHQGGTHARIGSGRLFLLALPLCAFFSAGCQPAVRNQGQNGLLATYSMMTLTADLPERARVQAVIAAADAVVRSRGYGVETVRATEEEGSLLAIPPKSAGSPRVWINAARVEGGTRVQIKPQPWGDEDVARSLLDGILARLGM